MRPRLLLPALAAVLGALLWFALRASPRDELLAGKVIRIDLGIPPESAASLGAQPKAFAPVTLSTPGEPRLERVALRLKGVSSFRPISDPRPGFSLRVGREVKDQRFLGLDVFQLNNSVQDGTFMNELFGSEMARHAGQPASRCTLALLSVNGQPRGTYVLKEGFDKIFLGRFHRDASGQLYDGGLHNDIQPGLELDRGPSGDKAPITEFSEALRDPDPLRRLARLERILDIDAYLRYLTIENILVQMDGYSHRANNYRTYHNPSTGKFTFVLHGMDNLLGFDAWGASDPRAYVLSVPRVAPLYPGASETAVAHALWTLPPEAGIRARFRRQAADLHARCFRDVDWPARAEARAADLARQLSLLDPAEGKAFVDRSREFVRRLRIRMGHVHSQFADLERLARPGAGPASLGDYPWVRSGDAVPVDEGGAKAYRLRVASGKAEIRLPLSLEPGAYRLSVPVRLSGLRAAAFRCRLGATEPAASPVLDSDGPSRLHAVELAVGHGDPALVIELGGEAGEALVDLAGLRLERLR